MTKNYVPCDETAIPPSVRFDVPRVFQGQAIEIAYGGFSRYEHAEGAPYKRVIDTSTAPRTVELYKLVDESFSVRHSHGLTETFPTYEAALDGVRAVYKSAAIGHPGDLTDGGDRTLVWVDADTATNDDGSRACATIRRRS